MISAILLAAGQSKRLLSENKLIKNYNGKPLINHVLSSLINSKVKKIVIVLGFDHLNVRKKILKNKKILFVINKNYKKGISSSIKTGLKKISNKNIGFLIVHGDMPFISKRIINILCQSLKIESKEIFIPVYKKKLGNPMAFKIKKKKIFHNLKGDKGAKKIIKNNKKEIKLIKVDSSSIHKDFDSIKDFNKKKIFKI